MKDVTTVSLALLFVWGCNSPMDTERALEDLVLSEQSLWLSKE